MYVVTYSFIFSWWKYFQKEKQALTKCCFSDKRSMFFCHKSDKSLMINVDTYFNVGIYDDTMHISSTNMKTAHYIDMRSPLTFGLSLCTVHSKVMYLWKLRCCATILLWCKWQSPSSTYFLAANGSEAEVQSSRKWEYFTEVQILPEVQSLSKCT